MTGLRLSIRRANRECLRSYDRITYANNNPVNQDDPSGDCSVRTNNANQPFTTPYPGVCVGQQALEVEQAAKAVQDQTCSSDPLSGSFWTGGNCLAGLFSSSTTGGGRETVGGVLTTVGSLAGLSAGAAAGVGFIGIGIGAFTTGTIVIDSTATASAFEAGIFAPTITTVASATTSAIGTLGTIGFASGVLAGTGECLDSRYVACAIDIGTAGLGNLADYLPFSDLSNFIIGTGVSTPPWGSDISIWWDSQFAGTYTCKNS